MARFTRISKREAKRLFAEGTRGVYLCPCKMAPEGPFSMAALVFGKEYLDRAESYRSHPDLWKGTLEETAWELMYNNWRFYSATHETGYYAHYYIES